MNVTFSNVDVNHVSSLAGMKSLPFTTGVTLIIPTLFNFRSVDAVIRIVSPYQSTVQSNSAAKSTNSDSSARNAKSASPSRITRATAKTGILGKQSFSPKFTVKMIPIQVTLQAITATKLNTVDFISKIRQWLTLTEENEYVFEVLFVSLEDSPSDTKIDRQLGLNYDIKYVSFSKFNKSLGNIAGELYKEQSS